MVPRCIQTSGSASHQIINDPKPTRYWYLIFFFFGQKIQNTFAHIFNFLAYYLFILFVCDDGKLEEVGLAIKKFIQKRKSMIST
jgi:hypothetical protein